MKNTDGVQWLAGGLSAVPCHAFLVYTCSWRAGWDRKWSRVIQKSDEFSQSLYLHLLVCSLQSIRLCFVNVLFQISGCAGSSLFRAFTQHILHRLSIAQDGPLVSSFSLAASSLLDFYSSSISGCGWLSSRMVSVLDSGAEGPGFKSQSRRYRVTVLGRLFIPIVPLFTKQQNW